MFITMNPPSLLMYFFVSILVLTAATTSAFVQERLQHPRKTTSGPSTPHHRYSSTTPKQCHDHHRRGNRRWGSSSLLQVSLSTPTTTTAAFGTNDVVSWDWNAVADHVFEDDQRPVILFDGICNLCNGGVNFALDHDAKGNFRFASMQSKVGQSLLLQVGRQPQDMSSIVVVQSDGIAFFESDAILRISQGLDGPFFVGLGYMGLLVPRVLRDALYHVVSENRYRFGERESCRLDFDGEFENRFVQAPEEL